MKILFNSRKKILVINPGVLFNNFKNEEKIKSEYDFHINTLNFDELNISRSYNEYNLILVDHTGTVYNNEKILNLIKILAKKNHVKTLLSFYEHTCKRIPLIHLPHDWFLNETILHQDLNENTHLFFKRLFDIIFVILTLPISIPLFITGCILNKIFSKGPVIFKQARIGKFEKQFFLYKIRTMDIANVKNNFTTPNDERITLIGKYLRKLKIDELPQLYNILIGEMSLIGPRPERVEYVEEYNDINPYYHIRHKIRPGITGWAQVNNPKATPEENLSKLEYDLFYLKNMSLKLDVKIIFKTIKVILTLNSL